jgi:L-threonylcarbamoyladenylate synthase
LLVNPNTPEQDAIHEAAHVIQRGGLVAFPTETVYGLGANALDAEAVSHIFAAKQRPASDPLIVHIADPSQLEHIAVDIPPLAHDLAARFWPGPLTLVLKRHPNIPPNVSAQADTVAVRMPRHPIALALLAQSGLPIAAPSANLFARPSPTTAAHVLEDLRGHVDLVLDGGATSVGVESTVLDLTQTPPLVLRPGGLSLEALRELLPSVAHRPRYLDIGENAAAPGMLLKHYSPRAELLLFRGAPDAAIAAMQRTARQLAAGGKRVGIMALDEEQDGFASLDAHVITLGSTSDLEQVARGLFAALRQLDALGVDAILVRGVEQSGIGLAIWDRLLRAAEGRIIEADTEA